MIFQLLFFAILVGMISLIFKLSKRNKHVKKDKQNEDIVGLKILHYVLSIVTFILAAYGLMTKNFEFQHYMILFLGLTMFVMGLQEFQKGQKIYGWLFVVVFLFSLFVSIQGFLLS